MKSKLILGDGLLGTELVKQTGWDFISRKKDDIDFTDFTSYREYIKDYDEIINCIAYTNTYDTEKDTHWNVNYKSVADLVTLCNVLDKKLIHISTDYIYTNSKEEASEDDVPVHCQNWYGYTKLLADGYIQLKSDNFLLLRGTHKKEPFTYDSAWSNQVGNFDYVSTMSEIIVKVINKDCKGIYNIGTQTKSMYELAKKTKLDVKCDKNQPVNVPKNITMNLDKLRRVIQ